MRKVKKSKKLTPLRRDERIDDRVQLVPEVVPEALFPLRLLLGRLPTPFDLERRGVELDKAVAVARKLEVAVVVVGLFSFSLFFLLFLLLRPHERDDDRLGSAVARVRQRHADLLLQLRAQKRLGELGRPLVAVAGDVDKVDVSADDARDDEESVRLYDAWAVPARRTGIPALFVPCFVRGGGGGEEGEERNVRREERK